MNADTTSSPADAAPAESPTEIEIVIPSDQAGLRLDIALNRNVPQISRTYAARLLKDGAILVESKPAKASYKVRGGERVSIELPEPEEIEAYPENISLAILYEDQDLIVVNKPAGMVTHPSSGHGRGALVNALLFHCKDLSSINGKLRPGIVHRLDKDTSGAIVAAKNDIAHRGLAEQFSGRTIGKEYVALCHGVPIKNEFACAGRIARHRIRRTEMTIAKEENEGREAYTEFTVLERFAAVKKFFVQARPKTGRTHQIRVHLAKSGFPILADALYGREPELSELGLHRHALHARRLSFTHPRTNEKLSFEAPLPADMQSALKALRG